MRSSVIAFPATRRRLRLGNKLSTLNSQRAKGDAAAIEQIVMNMERWRWLPDDLGPRYLLVNIPAFRLDAIENGIPQGIVQKEILPNNNFLFPNHYNVHLHDTPAQALFNRVGCTS